MVYPRVNVSVSRDAGTRAVIFTGITAAAPCIFTERKVTARVLPSTPRCRTVPDSVLPSFANPRPSMSRLIPTVTRTGALAVVAAAAALGSPLRAQATTAPAAHHATATAASRDSTRAFLSIMVDHHQGLIVMGDSARARAARAGTKADAHKLRDEQATEQRRMETMLTRTYHDSTQPKVLPSNQAMLDTLGRASGAEYDHTFYRFVIAHHRQAIDMIDQALPHLTPDVRRMAAAMRTKQQGEIAQLERKMRAV